MSFFFADQDLLNLRMCQVVEHLRGLCLENDELQATYQAQRTTKDGPRVLLEIQVSNRKVEQAKALFKLLREEGQRKGFVVSEHWAAYENNPSGVATG